MTRADWQQIAEERLIATEALRAAGIWASAYYLGGYAVEFGLKSCVLARVSSAPEIIFSDRKFSERCWTHDVEQLVKLAGLELDRHVAVTANAALATNWLTVKDWSENTRYMMKTQAEAQSLFDALTNSTDGVMQWIRVRW